MAVINPYSAAVAQIFAENAVAAKQDKRVIRDADLARQIADIEKRMALEQIASDQKQFEMTTSIAQKGASGVQSAIQLGQKLEIAGEVLQINSDLHSGADNYGQDHGQQLLNTDLGQGLTVEDTLGTDAQGRRIEDPAQRREVATAKLDALMSGNFNSAEDLRAIGFSDQEAEALMGMKESFGGLSQDEAVGFLLARAPVMQQDAERDKIHEAASALIKDALFAAPLAAARIGAKSAKDAANAVEEDRGNVQRDRGTQSRMSWLATEQLNDASKLVMNKKDSTYKP
jgi:hypothetical protein